MAKRAPHNKRRSPKRIAPTEPIETGDLHTLGLEDPHRAHEPASDAVLASRYALRRLLGTGTYGRVYAAWDRVRSHEVAIKILHNLRPLALLRFKHEFRAVNALHHPNLVRVYTLGRDRDTWFIVMEKIDGVPFTMEARPTEHGQKTQLGAAETTALLADTEHPPDPPDDPPPPAALTKESSLEPYFTVTTLRDRLGQLCQGILALHQFHIVHCDLKPSNVMVDADGRVVILDFGVSRYTNKADIHTQEGGGIVGTRPYMAPEITRAGEAHPAMDWYAFGMMLAESLTGHSASALAATPWELLTTLLGRAAAHWREYDQYYALCIRLLDPDPATRADHHHILSVVYGDDAPRIHRQYRHQSDLFAGRDDEMAVLERAWEDFVQGQPQTLIVEGTSGMGKSMLCRQFVRRVCSGRGAPYVLMARCKNDELIGYRAFDELVDGIAATLHAMDADERADILPYCTPALCALFPTLPCAHSGHDPRPAPDISTPADALLALRTLLGHIAERRPILIWVEDVHQADPQSLHWLAKVFGPGARPNVFVLLTQRPHHELQRTTVDITTFGYAVPLLSLKPLDGATARKVITHWLPAEDRDDQALISTIERVGGGRPDALRTLCRYSKALRQLPADVTVDALLRAHLPALPPQHFELLCALSISTTPISLWMLSDVVNQTPTALERILRPLISQLMVSTTSSERNEHYAINDPLVRRTILRVMDRDTRRNLHARYAELLRSHRPSSIQPIAVMDHLLGAGDQAAARAWAIDYADIAERRGVYETAAQLYERLFALPPNETRTHPTAIYLRAINCELRTGRLQQAANHMIRLAERTAGDDAYALRMRAAEAYTLCGQFEKSHAQSKIAQHNHRTTTFPKIALPQALRVAAQRERIERRLRHFDPAHTTNDPVSPATAAMLSTYRVAGIDVSIFDAMRAMEFSMYELDFALDLGRRATIARALASYTAYIASGSVRQQERARRWGNLAIELAQDSADRTALEWAKVCRAAIDYQQGYYGRAWTQCAASRRWVLKHAPEQTMILSHLSIYRILCDITAGDITGLREAYYGQIVDARRHNNHLLEASVTMTGFITWLIDDAPQAARMAMQRIHANRSNRGYQLFDYLWQRSLAELCLYESHHDELHAHIRTFQRIEQSLIARSIEAIRAEAYQTHGRLIMARAVAKGHLPARDARLLRTWGTKLSHSTIPLSRGWGEHLLAGLYALQNDRQRAAKYLRRSIDTHRAHGLMFFCELSMAAGILSGLLSWHDAAAFPDPNNPYSRLHSMGVLRPERLVRAYHPYA